MSRYPRSDSPESQEKTALRQSSDDLSFLIEKEKRYHQRRRAFYEHYYAINSLVALLSGASAFIKFAPTAAGLVMLVAGSFDLIFTFTTKARDHALLHRRFVELALQITDIKDCPDEDTIRLWRCQLQDIEADEPPVYWALEASCYNETLNSRGIDRKRMIPLTFFQSMLMNWIHFDASQFPRPVISNDGSDTGMETA